MLTIAGGIILAVLFFAIALPLAALLFRSETLGTIGAIVLAVTLLAWVLA